MKVVFGERSCGLEYQNRKSVYAIIFNPTKEKVLTVETKKGHHFLPGGGIEYGEGFEECLVREMLEETGYSILIGSFIGNASLYFQSTKNEPILSDGYFYLAQLLVQIQEPIDDDHFIKWIDIETIGELLVHEHHVWAVKVGLTM